MHSIPQLIAFGFWTALGIMVLPIFMFGLPLALAGFLLIGYAIIGMLAGWVFRPRRWRGHAGGPPLASCSRRARVEVLPRYRTTQARGSCCSGLGALMRGAVVFTGLMVVLLALVPLTWYVRRGAEIHALAASASTPAAVNDPVQATNSAVPADLLKDNSNPPWTVEGGPSPSRADAVEEALRLAQRKVTVYLRNQDPSLEWVPPLDYIQDRLVKSKPWKEELKDVDVLGEKKPTYRVWMEVEISPEARHDMLHRAREYLAQQRMMVIGRLLAVLVVLLAAVAGYLRLEESTKGYYTGWLKLAAIGLVAAACIGLLLVA